MKIFIGGSKSFDHLSDLPISFLKQIDTYCTEEYDFLIGDCRGADTLIQQYLTEKGYRRVSIYASGNTVRNNIGNWSTVNVPVDPKYTGFAFYRQKDIRMEHDCDFGVMLWDVKSKGTLRNIVDLVTLGKSVFVCFHESRTGRSTRYQHRFTKREMKNKRDHPKSCVNLQNGVK